MKPKVIGKDSTLAQMILSNVHSTTPIHIKEILQQGEDEMGRDRVHELEIYALEEEMIEVKNQLEKAKFKYGQRQISDLEDKEKALQDRMDYLRTNQTASNKNFKQMAVKIQEQRDKLIKVKLKENNIN